MRRINTWLEMSKRLRIALLSAAILIALVLSSAHGGQAAAVASETLNEGPYLSELTYHVYSSESERILALQADDIDTDQSFFDQVHYETLNMDPDIEIHEHLRNGYGHLTINCRDYPLNISGLRRAFAFAFDKESLVTDLFDGFAVAHDSIVPAPNGFCVEDKLPWNYYTAQPDIGNRILDNLGFAINGGTGFRDAPNGSAFSITIEYPSSAPELGGGVASAAVDALTSLHIDAVAQPADFNEYISRVDLHGDYDMVYYAKEYAGNTVEWLGYEYWSDYADVAYQNPTNFANASYDAWRNHLLEDPDYEDVYDASLQMQKILHENVPLLVVYENVYLQGYRTDSFTNFIPDISEGISGQWTNRRAYSKTGDIMTGTLRSAISQSVDSFNHFVANQVSSERILDNLYSYLWRLGPDLTPVPDLATNLLVETHADNIAVPAGYTRYTIDILHNAQWTDGMPLTANDVANTFIYLKESAAYGNPEGMGLTDLVSATAPSTYRAVIEFNSESYWDFAKIAHAKIIPEHIYNQVTGVEYNEWTTLTSVRCGPFTLTDSSSPTYGLTRYAFYHYEATNPEPTVSQPADVSYEVGTVGHEILWEASDDNPLLYSIFRNMTLVDTNVWNGTDISINIDGLAVGTYNYTLFLFDNSLNMVNSTVWVTVTPHSSTSGGLDPQMLLIIGVAGSAVIVVIIIYAIRSRP